MINVIFYALKEGHIVVANWRRLCNGLRSQGSFGGRPPAPETLVWPGTPLEDFAPPALTQLPALTLS
jgi:hypothetical protein